METTDTSLPPPYAPKPAAGRKQRRAERKARKAARIAELEREFVWWRAEAAKWEKEAEAWKAEQALWREAKERARMEEKRWTMLGNEWGNRYRRYAVEHGRPWDAGSPSMIEYLKAVDEQKRGQQRCREWAKEIEGRERELSGLVYWSAVQWWWRCQKRLIKIAWRTRGALEGVESAKEWSTLDLEYSAHTRETWASMRGYGAHPITCPARHSGPELK
jgi:hypothetical protein